MSRVKTLFCFHFTDLILKQQYGGNNTLWIFHTEMCRDYYWRIWKFLNMYENVLDRAHEFQCKFKIGSWCKGSSSNDVPTTSKLSNKKLWDLTIFVINMYLIWTKKRAQVDYHVKIILAARPGFSLSAIQKIYNFLLRLFILL